MFDLSDVFLCAVFATFCMLWWNAQGVKQIALLAVKGYCKKMDLQLLDEGVVLRGFWLKRDSRGRIHLWRSYNFEFTATGDDRSKGRVILLGNRVESIDVDAYRLN